MVDTFTVGVLMGVIIGLIIGFVGAWALESFLDWLEHREPIDYDDTLDEMRRRL